MLLYLSSLHPPYHRRRGSQLSWRGCWSWCPEPWWQAWWRFRTCPPWWEHKAPALYPSLVMNGVNLGYNDNGDHRRCAWTNPTSGGRNQNQDTRPHGLLCLTAESRLRCCCISQFQIYDISWKQICILFEFAFSDLLNIVSKFVHQASLALFGSKVGHQVLSLALPHCFGMSYWHHQLVLGWYLHQPESHQSSLQKVSQSPGSDKKDKKDKREKSDYFWSCYGFFSSSIFVKKLLCLVN